MKRKRSVVLYIAMSLDGFISKVDDDIGFLSLVEQENEDYGYSDFVKTTDTIIIGRKTYDKVISMGIDYPHNAKVVYILSRTLKSVKSPYKIYSGNLTDLILSLKGSKGKDIYVDGGAEIVNELLKYNLIDEFYISIIPILLGNGIPLFNRLRPELKLKLIKSKHFEKGLVQLHYVKKDN
jgi:dihydrofolate reductase